jgi:hypothetical protein
MAPSAQKMGKNINKGLKLKHDLLQNFERPFPQTIITRIPLNFSPVASMFINFDAYRFILSFHFVLEIVRGWVSQS